MNEFETYEFTVQKRLSRADRMKRAATVAALILGFCAIFGILCAVNLPWLLAVVVLLYVPFWMCVMRFFKEEYEYSMTSGVLTFRSVFDSNNSLRKKRAETLIRDIREIAPYAPDTRARLEAAGVRKIIRMASSPDAPDLYCAVFDQDGKPVAVLFEATRKALQILRFYNPGTVVTDVSR